MSSFQPRPVQATWRVRCRDGWAHGEIWTHPIGWEFRVYWDGELQRSQAYRDVAEAQQDADDTLVRLEGYNRERPAESPTLRAAGFPTPGTEPPA